MKRRRVAGLARDCSAAVAVEATFALSLLLVPLCLAMVDYAMAMSDEMRLDRAMHAAVLYVYSNQTGFTSSGITTAANAGFGAGAPTLTVGSSTACQCVSSAYSPTGAVSCAGSCASGQTVATYETITLSASFTLLVSIPALSSPLSASVSGTVRTQ